MNIIVTANIVPFMRGGADYHIEGVINQLRKHGHQVETIRFPFKFSPESDIQKLMDFCQNYDLSQPNGAQVDRVISLQFPAYGVKHPHHTVWLMHQHRAVYELYEQQQISTELKQLKKTITAYDTQALKNTEQLYSNSQTVSARLKKYNQLDSTPLYHPPFSAEKFYCEQSQGYIFCPSRLERLKRQDLLILAAKYLKTPVKIIIAGDGGQRQYYQQLIQENNLEKRVRLVGMVSEAEKYAFYAHSLAVFFAPYAEDYGYITLEAMLSSKPVLSCDDSGGPLEFIQDQQTGYITETNPQQIANKIDQLYENQHLAESLGQQGKAHYQNQNISWDNVIKHLLKVME